MSFIIFSFDLFFDTWIFKWLCGIDVEFFKPSKDDVPFLCFLRINEIRLLWILAHFKATAFFPSFQKLQVLVTK